MTGSKRPSMPILLYAATAAALLIQNPASIPGQNSSVAPAAGAVPQLEFEVASVKPSAPDASTKGNDLLIPFGNAQPKSGLLSANMPLAIYMMFAYDIEDPGQIQSLSTQLPDWAMREKFDIEARAEGVPTREQMRLMLQSLLRDRFKLAIHYETHQGAVNALVLDRPGVLGPKLRIHPENAPCQLRPEDVTPQDPHADRPAYCGIDVWRADGLLHIRLIDASMGDTAKLLNAAGGLVGERDVRPIEDKTALVAKYDVEIEFAPSTGAGDDSGGGPTFTAALRDQLGLKLVKDTGPVQTLVIDHVERPSAD